MADEVVLYSGPVVTRRDARKRREKRYFTGKPCRHGHISQRQSRGSACVECERLRVVPSPYDYVKSWRLKHPEARTEEARRYRARHPEKVKATAKRFQDRHRSRLRPIWAKQAREKRKNDPEGNRRRMLAFKARKEEALACIAGRPRPAVCEVCQSHGIIVFDHCHLSGNFRGWICDRCNKVLGLVKDNPKTLRELAVYIEKANGNAFFKET